MNNFTFNIPTEIRFGKGQISCLPEELSQYGNRVLLTYGGGSIKRSGLYDKVKELLKDFEVYELGGIEPNPKLKYVVTGAMLCKEKVIDVIFDILAVESVPAVKETVESSGEYKVIYFLFGLLVGSIHEKVMERR